ncbi:XRE family transcriptional regulator [Rhodoligotrophos ferricapiens]|uniref:XRE family transcriptional regulator n=1 Tax=Rhodoligotrophos ferricapiens TaxID=3069264 RepID=UPI00315CBC22
MFLVETNSALVATKMLMTKPVELPPIAKRLKEAREALGLSQPELAERVGMSQQGIGAIEAGRSIRPKKLRELARALGRTEDWLLGEGSDDAAATPAAYPKHEPNAETGGPVRLPRQRIPLYGGAIGGSDGRFVLNGHKLKDVLAPPSLEGVRNAYCVYQYGTSMEPRYFAGEVHFVNPNLPVRRGDFVVAQIMDEEGEPPAAFVKRFISWNSKELILEQYEPRENWTSDEPEAEKYILRFPSERVVSVHVIVQTGRE